MKRRRTAFSLVEVLVVIAVVGLLIAISIPAIGAVRLSAWRLKSLSNLRQVSLTVEQYTGEYRSYPFGSGALIELPNGERFGLFFDPWLLDRHWNVITQPVAPWQEHYLVWLSPRADPARFESLFNGDLILSNAAVPSYRYSTSFIASPRVWDPDQTAEASDLRGLMPADVLSPSEQGPDVRRRTRVRGGPRPRAAAPPGALCRRERLDPLGCRCHGACPEPVVRPYANALPGHPEGRPRPRFYGPLTGHPASSPRNSRSISGNHRRTVAASNLGGAGFSGARRTRNRTTAATVSDGALRPPVQKSWSAHESVTSCRDELPSPCSTSTSYAHPRGVSLSEMTCTVATTALQPGTIQATATDTERTRNPRPLLVWPDSPTVFSVVNSSFPPSGAARCSSSSKSSASA